MKSRAVSIAAVVAAVALSIALAPRRLASGATFVVSATSVQTSEASATQTGTAPQIHSLKITLLSTMLVGNPTGLGEWGFSALVEADGHRILVDTGAHPETVLQNARDLGIDLSGVREVILTHNHWDHVTGLITLRREMMKKDAASISIVHVARGIFYSRPSPKGEDNAMIAIRKEYEALGGKFIEHAEGADIFPGAWLTGPVPRKFPERNWSASGKVQTPDGLVEDTIPEDQSLVLNTEQGLVVVTGCGHAGVINILTDAVGKFAGRSSGVRQVEPAPAVYAVIGGLHLFPASDEQLDWTGDEFKQFKVANLLGAHCTGIEAVYRLRQRAGLTRKTAVVGTVGSMLTLEKGIVPGVLAQ
jgi:7,8-dihydropterin-6-yl-methyl-4-(beta-D-ribofuranosyl)aminobenzene 5'-phosphate synthase